MLSFWGKPFTTLVLLAAAALIAGLLFGTTAALAGFSGALLVWLFLHLRHLYQFRRWLRDPSLETVPTGKGLWAGAFAGLYRLMRRQSRSESRLSAALKRFQRAGAAIPEGMVILDEDDRIEWCNPQAESHLGLDLAHDEGQQITYLVRHPQFVEYLNSLNYNEPLAVRLPRNTEILLSIQPVPYGDKQKLLLSRDITHFERVETIRRDFVANVSHELRTPLTVLCGFLETLIGMPRLDSDMTRRTLRLMQDQALRMQRLVEDLLTLSRLESAQYPLREENVDVPTLVRGLYQDAVALSAGRHRMQLHIESADWLTGSTEELRSAFGNLISNAIRYTPEGGEVHLRWHRVAGQPVFAVEDSGIGIEVQHIPRLTERFYRVDHGRSRETGGTGLGLAIVKHVLSRHQAKLDIVSDPGRGSRFSVVFPAQRIVQPLPGVRQLSA
ncbi:MAG TPA: phosphate regulon sensor histidine kinase PhoR [Burkholderiales bacterium]|nr:phosphate regulon sensor histidine kinase PhoR [Burkholderiales bacterium]